MKIIVFWSLRSDVFETALISGPALCVMMGGRPTSSLVLPLSPNSQKVCNSDPLIICGEKIALDLSASLCTCAKREMHEQGYTLYCTYACSLLTK